MFFEYSWKAGCLFYKDSSTNTGGEWKKCSLEETVQYLKQCIREISLDFYENDKGECCSDIGSKGVLRMIGE